ncbi:cation transporter [candidate division KSB1 bacterium]|nr:cation transporter [candidate division KSB1 bacterium]
MSDHHEHNHEGVSELRTAFFLNFGFTLLELFGGFWTNSVAILSDAIHDLGDSVSLGIAWILQIVSSKGRDSRFSYGYRRFSLLGALISTLILIAGSVIVLTRALPRLLHPEPANASGMLIFAIIGVVVNGLAALKLKHSHSMNARMAALHLLEDILGWVAVLIVSITLLFTQFYILDSILSILITGIILFNVIRNLKRILKVFLQAAPEQVRVEAIENQLIAIPKVRSCHDTHCWSLDGEHHVLTTHIVLDSETSQEQIVEIKTVIKNLAKSMDFSHITVETEFEDLDCTMKD